MKGRRLKNGYQAYSRLYEVYPAATSSFFIGDQYCKQNTASYVL